jgi:hypothetical protein
VVYWVTDRIDACHISILPWHMNHHAARYDGVLGQITATFSGTHPNYAICEKWHRNMSFCHAAIISPLNGDAPVVEVAGGGVAMLGEWVQTGVGVAGLPDGVKVTESVKKFCLRGSLPRGLKLSYFRHWRPMAESPHLHDGILFEVAAVGDTNSGVSHDAIWRRVMVKKKECKTAVLAVLDAPNSGLLVCHLEAKGSAAGTKKKATMAEKQKRVANPIGVQLKKYALVYKNAMLAMAKLESALATSELRKVAEANMSELGKIGAAIHAQMDSGADDHSTGAKGSDAVDVDLTD